MHARSGAYYAVEQKEMIYPRNCQPRSAERKPPSAGLQPTEVSHLYWRFGFFLKIGGQPAWLRVKCAHCPSPTKLLSKKEVDLPLRCVPFGRE